MLIEGKHNKTVEWLETVDKDKVINLAVSEGKLYRNEIRQ